MGLAIELVAAAPLHDEEVLDYLLVGLLYDYDPFIISMTTKVKPLFLQDMFAHLVTFEAHQLQHVSDIMTIWLVHHLERFVAKIHAP